MENSKILRGKSTLMHVYRNKLTGEFVDEDGSPTEDIYEAVGYASLNDALKGLETFDEPEEWYIVMKLITETIIGEPVEVTQFI